MQDRRLRRSSLSVAVLTLAALSMVGLAALALADRLAT